MSHSPTVDLACELIRRQSVTPEDAECLTLIGDRLSAIGFTLTPLPFDEVSNLWAVRGDSGPLLVFAGHTDVVPTGPLEQWDTPPFEPTIKNDLIYGRGAADMKGSIAAMITACERFVETNPHHAGRIGFLLTSDEEGPAINGTVKVVDWLQSNNEQIDWCIIGEPTSSNKLGDIIKNGRRGSLNFNLTINGQQGHIAYPQLAENPIHRLAPALDALVNEVWDEGNEYFPATSFQISNINAGTGATNVIPGSVNLLGNFRFSTEVTDQALRHRTETILNAHKLNYDIEWNLSGQPFITPVGTLVTAVQSAISKVTGYDTELSTSGGTSDGRFIAPTGAQVIELGPLNDTIHKVNECVSATDLDTLSSVYYECLQNILTNTSV
ncbi:succinyl-diaminopimelate desuccinylase [Aurantivibrio plasticivorans]